MAVNLPGLPSQAKGAAHTATTVFLAAHMLITLGLLASAVMIIRANPDAHEADLANSLVSLGARPDDTGRHVEALAVAEEATEIWRRLARASPEPNEPGLALSLTLPGPESR